MRTAFATNQDYILKIGEFGQFIGSAPDIDDIPKQQLMGRLNDEVETMLSVLKKRTTVQNSWK